jgi:large subunit ribosomal protein L4
MARTASRLGGSGTVTLDPVAFEASFNMPVVHEAVRAELNARRHGTASTKTRGEVSGGGAKPWRQKGTGRARAGSSRSPVWTGGGTVFGPTPRRYTVKVNRKARRAALRSVLSLHAQRDSLAVFDAGAFSAPSTRQAADLLEGWGAPLPTLVILADEEAAAGTQVVPQSGPCTGVAGPGRRRGGHRRGRLAAGVRVGAPGTGSPGGRRR